MLLYRRHPRLGVTQLLLTLLDGESGVLGRSGGDCEGFEDASFVVGDEGVVDGDEEGVGLPVLEH